MNKIWFFLILGFVGVSSLGRFMMTDAIRGSEFEMYTLLRNPTSSNLYDVNVKLDIYDLGERLVSNYVDIRDGKSEVAYISWNVPDDIEPGTYIAKLSASNSKFRDSKHVFVTIN